jgi:ferredoxin
VGRFRRHPGWSSIAGAPVGIGRGRHGPAVVAVCGEQLDRGLRDALARSLGAGAGTGAGEPDAGTAVELVVVEELCSRPERLRSFYQSHRPAGLVVAACGLGAARAAADLAIADGADPAHVVAASLAPALGRGAAERTLLVTASCRAWSRRAEMLASAPPAGHLPWQAGQPLDRRGLFGAWRGRPSYRARVDDSACVGTERCGRCIPDCPTGAITVSGTTPQVDPRKCVSCGWCVVTCPSRAVSMAGADLDGIAAELDSLVRDGVGKIAVACERAGTEGAAIPERAGSGPHAVIFLPCAATISPGAVLALSASGVQLDVDPCSDCRSHEMVEATTRFTGRLASVLGADARGDRSPVPAPVPVPVPDIAGEEGRATGVRVTWHEPEATNHIVAQLATSQSRRPTEGMLLDDGAPTFVVRVDGARCTICGSCSLACPCTALAFDPLTKVLAADSSQCTGCRRCVAVCPEEAVTVERGVDVGAVVGGPARVEVPFHRWACPECGTTASTDPLIASVQRRLAARGRSPALVASLQRCRACSGAYRADGG